MAHFIRNRRRSCSAALSFAGILGLAACSGGDGDASEQGTIDQPLTVDTAGHAFMAPYETASQAILKTVAATPAKWAYIMSTSYGADYNKAAAEQLRTKIVAGDFSWTPVVHLVPRGALGGTAVGAYAASINAVFIDESTPAGATRSIAYLEELGHYIDTRVRKTDAPGDEGAIFRRIALGDLPSDAELQDLRTTDDHGTFVWNGRTLAVEHISWFGVGACVIDPIACVAVVTTETTLNDLVYPALNGADQLLDWVAQQPFSWAGTVKSWLGAGLGDVALRIVDVVLPQNPLESIQDLYALKNTVFGVVKDVVDAPQLFQRGIDRISAGDYTQGITDILSSLAMVDTAIGANPDTIFTLGQETLSGIQTRLGLEPIGRGLSDRERALLWPVFRDSLDYNEIRIKEGFAGLYSINDRPLTLQNTIYLKDEKHDDTLVHESTHTWQFEHGGTLYKLEAVLDQAQKGMDIGGAYDWGVGLQQSFGFDQLGPEQQARLIEDGFRMALQRGELVQSGFTEVDPNAATAYFVQGWHIVSAGGWINGNWTLGATPPRYHVTATTTCHTTDAQWAALGMPTPTQIPAATLLFDDPRPQAALPDCDDTAVTRSPLVAAPCGSLVPGEQLDASPAPDFFKSSCDQTYWFVLQSDGNLVAYQNNTPIWATNTVGSGATQVVMQSDGNLVLYSPSGPVWASNTAGNPGAYLAIQNDGNLVVYTTAGVPIWASMQPAASTECGTLRAETGLAQGTTLTSCDGRFTMNMELDGNLVVAQNGVGALWTSNTPGNGNLVEAVLQSDGNLVLYNRAFNPARPIWTSNTAGNAGAVLRLQDDGNLVIYDANSVPLWASNTCCH